MRINNFFLYIGIILSICSISISSYAQQINKSISTPKGDIGFLEYKPTDYNPNGSYKHPLIIFLHGIGERGNGTTQLANVAANGVPKSIKNGHDMKFQWNGVNESFIVLSPQLSSSYGWWQEFYIEEMIQYAKKNLNIDPDRIFLTGLSLGGGGVWYYAGLNEGNAKKLAGLVICCGTCQSVDLCNIAKAKLPTWAFHAQNDGSVSASCTIGHIYKLNTCSNEVPPYMTIWPDGGHGIWDRVFSTNHNWQNPNIYEWLLGQSRAKEVNKRPIANAGNDIKITTAQATATLNASQSKDLDGKLVRFIWRKISGPSTGNIQQPTSTNGITTVTNLTIQGTYSYEVKVIDDRADWTFDTVNVVVTNQAVPNTAPVAVIANPNQTIQLPTTPITLDASGSYDSDGYIAAYSWSYVSGPTQYNLTQNNQSKATLSNVTTGTYVFRVTVTDNNGSSNSTNISLTFLAPPNLTPIASIKPVSNITLPNNTAFLDGTASSDPEGKSLSYVWSLAEGPTQFTLQNPTNASTNVNGLVEGKYTFQLKVTDPEGSHHTAYTSFEVLAKPNAAPIAVPGDPIEITAPVSQVILNGSNSYDPDGTIASYQWTLVSGDNTALIENAQSAITTISQLKPGIYLFRLTVVDNEQTASSQTIQVTVKEPPVNQLPVIVLDKEHYQIQLPINQVNIDFSKSYDPDGTINSFIFDLTQGNSGFILNTGSNNITNITNLTEGQYVFKLTAVDDKNAKSEKNFTIEVLPAPQAENIPPIADAGNNLIMEEKSGWITLDGSKSYDPDGTTLSYQWTFINGPAQYELNNSTNAEANFNPLNTGTFVFELRVSDSHGASAMDTLYITVYPDHKPTDNFLPVAIAGNDTTITLPSNSITLNASASYDPFGEVKEVLWSKISGPSSYHIEKSNSAITQLTNLVEGVYRFKVRVWGDQWESTNDTIQITVLPEPNYAPIANAGNNIEITLPNNTVSLNGTASTDPNGIIDIASYQWKSLSGSNAVIENANQVLTTVSGLEEGTYVFELTVTDKKGLTDVSTVTIIVNAAPNLNPIAVAGNDLHIQLPATTGILTGAGSSDPNVNDIITYHWKYIGTASGVTIVTPNQVTTVVNDLTLGTHPFVLTVTDNRGGTDTDTIQIIVHPEANRNPIAVAGNRQTIRLPINFVTLNGNQSRDPDGNSTIVSYEWKFHEGPSQYTIQQPNNIQTTVSNLREGNYIFSLTVKDTANASSIDTVHIIVLPKILQAPVANAGSDVTITLPVNSISLNGSASYDPDGNIDNLSYLWEIIPPSGLYQIANTTNASSSLTSLEEGTYRIKLTVTDEDGLSDSDTLLVKVNPIPNKRPVAITDNDFEINMESTSFELNGSNSYDPDGENTIASVVWKMISGPNQPTISPTVNKNATVTNFVEGVYVFEITITDNRNLSAKASITVTVKPKPAPTNILPIVSIEAVNTISLPTNSVELDGSKSSDPDGTIVRYEWRRISGPTQFNILQNRDAITEVNNLVEGTYVFRLTVTDDDNGINFKNITINVLPAPNVLPIANAGANRTIYLPNNTAVLNGSTSKDPDGQILSFEWIKINGPNTFKIENSKTSIAQLSNLVLGVYRFRLLVIDNLGGRDSADVTINVQPDPNKPPIVNPGVNQTIQLPSTAVQLDGSNSYDPEGDELKYEWSLVSGATPVTINNHQSAYAYTDLKVVGTYTFNLRVTDSKGLFANGNVTITVLPKPNDIPVAIAVTDSVIYEPNNSIQLNGTASRDDDGNIISYEWTQLSGEPVLILLHNQSIAIVSDLKIGEYEFMLQVIDNKGAIAYDTVKVKVLPDPLSKGHLSVYPNPIVSGILKVTYKTKVLDDGILNVYSSDGKIVYKRFIKIDNYITQWEIPVSQLTKGVYSVEITIPLKQRTTKQFIKL